MHIFSSRIFEYIWCVCTAWSIQCIFYVQFWPLFIRPEIWIFDQHLDFNGFQIWHETAFIINRRNERQQQQQAKMIETSTKKRQDLSVLVRRKSIWMSSSHINGQLVCGDDITKYAHWNHFCFFFVILKMTFISVIFFRVCLNEYRS